MRAVRSTDLCSLPTKHCDGDAHPLVGTPKILLSLRKVGAKNNNQISEPIEGSCCLVDMEAIMPFLYP